MNTLTISNISDDLKQRLQQRASSNQKSIEEEAKSILENSLPELKRKSKSVEKAKLILEQSKHQAHTSGVDLKREIYGT